MTSSPRSTVWTDLGADWARIATSRHAQNVLTRWTATNDRWERFENLAGIVSACHHPTVGGVDPNDLLRGLAALHDPLARRVILQALVPGLRAIAVREGEHGCVNRPWVDRAHLDQEVIGAAWDEITRLDDSEPWPARLVTRRVARRIERAARRWAHTQLTTEPLPTTAQTNPAWAVSGADPLELGLAAQSAAERLAAALIDRVEDGRLSRSDAAVVFAYRVQGLGMDEIAARTGRTLLAARKQRFRIEQCLVA